MEWKSFVNDKCERQLNLKAEEFKQYVKEHFESSGDTLYKIVLDATKNQEERDLVDQTFNR